MRIDAHQHFWDPARGDYCWLGEDSGSLFRVYGPDDLWPLMQASDIDASILVQAAPTEAETEYLFGLAEITPWVAGVVGWIDLLKPDVAARIASTRRRGPLVGIRPMLQDLPDKDWILNRALWSALDAITQAGVAFDALVHANQLGTIDELAGRHPELPIVLDHAGKPEIGSDLFSWRADIERLAQRTNVHCKFSGLMTQRAAGTSAAELRQVAAHLLVTFGPERLIWGSDWPVLTSAGSYGEWFDVTQDLMSGLDNEQRAAVMGENALAFYGLTP